MPSVLSVNNASFFFDSVQALKEVSFSVEKGETFGLIGPDGAGKTTLIRLFCGLLPPAYGNCSVLEFDTVRQKSELIKKIGYLSQKFSLYGDLSVEENIDFFAEIHGVKNFEKRKDELLEFMDLARFKDRLSGALSGGMKQKLALACTLIHTPDIIFLDEPTNGVDPVARRDFWEILQTVSQQGVTIVISTPYLDEAERCNRIAFMNAGSVIACETPRASRKYFPHTLIEVVCSPVKEAAALLAPVAGVLSVQIFGDKLHLATVGDYPDTATLRGFLADKVTVTLIRTIRPTLEDVFITLLQRQGDAA